MSHELTFSATIRLRDNGKASASWHFVTVDQEVSQQIRDMVKERPRKGFGSVRVRVRIGFVKWETSVFPDSKSGCYVLPIKASVRKELQIGEGDEVLVVVEVV